MNIGDAEAVRLLENVSKGTAYSELERIRIAHHDYKEVFVVPNNNKMVAEAKKLAQKLFDNCTVIIENTQIYVIKRMLCSNELKSIMHYKEFTPIIIEHGKICQPDKTCERCKNMVKKYVGECYSDEFVPNKQGQEGWAFRTNEPFRDFVFVKPGYVKDRDFAEDVDFTRETVEKRIEEYSDRGKWRTQLNQVRKEFCKDCVKYHTKTCQRGYNGYQKPVKCMYLKEKLIERLVAEIKVDFGSLSRAHWFFSQCGQIIQYKDPYTKRVSKRYIAVPGNRKGDLKVTGFFMSLARYPYGVGDYGNRGHRYRWRSDAQMKKDKKYENYISLERYMKEYKEILQKTKYEKKLHEELTCAAYLIYRYVTSTPGEQTGLGYGTTYLIYISIIGTAHNVIEVGIGNSKYVSDRNVNDLRSLFDIACLSIDKK